MMFYSRKIEYKHRDVTILLQNENGPCPLLSVANALSLKGAIIVPQQAHSSMIPVATVEDIVQQFLNGQRTLFEDDKNMGYAIDTAIAKLPTLHQGLHVNPKFDHVDSFEPTEELAVFDASRLRLLHGMTVDAQEVDLAEEIGQNSYNVMTIQAVNPASVPHFAQWVEQFPTQLTFRGLIDLTEETNEDEIAVFFRNNHFAVLTKSKGVLYTLVTDVGIAQAKPYGPWESLVDLTGESSVFRDSHFGHAPSKPPSPIVAAINNNTTNGDVDEDEDEPPMPTPPRRNSQLVRREGNDREVVMLNKEQDTCVGESCKRRSSLQGGQYQSPNNLETQFSQAEVPPPQPQEAQQQQQSPRGQQNNNNKPAEDRCCSVM